MLIFGEVVEVSPDGSRVRLRVPDADGMVTHWLPVTQGSTGRHQLRVMPAIGERMAAVLDKDMIRGATIGAIYTDQNPAPDASAEAVYARFQDGSVFQGNGSKEWRFDVPAGGSITLKVGRSEIVINDSGITVRAIAFSGVRA
jgi:phage baseplate assembly protein gpV